MGSLSQIDMAEDLYANTDRILPGFRALIHLPTLPDQVIRVLRKDHRNDQIQLSVVTIAFFNIRRVIAESRLSGDVHISQMGVYYINSKDFDFCWLIHVSCR